MELIKKANHIINNLHSHVRRNYVYILLTLFLFQIIDLMLTYIGVFIYGFPEGNYIAKAFFDSGFYFEALLFKFVGFFLIAFSVYTYYKYNPKPIKFLSWIMFGWLFSGSKVLIDWIVVIIEYGVLA